MRSRKINKIILIFLSLVLLFGMIPSPVGAAPYPRHPRPADFGDINRDGVISAVDVTLLRRYIAATDKEAFIGEHPSFSEDNANLIGGDVIDAAAVALLRRYISAENPSAVHLGPPRHVHSMGVSNRLRIRDTVYDEEDIWFAIKPQQTSLYELMFYPYDANVFMQVFDSGLWPVMPEDGAFKLYAGEIYYICVEFNEIIFPQEFEFIAIPRITLLSDHWDYDGKLFDDSPENWLAIAPLASGEYSFCFDFGSDTVSANIWKYDGITPLSLDADGNGILYNGEIYFIEISTTVEDFYSFWYDITVQLLYSFEEEYFYSEYPFETVEFSCCEFYDGQVLPLSTFYQINRSVMWLANDGSNRLHSHVCFVLHTADSMVRQFSPPPPGFGAGFQIVGWRGTATNGTEIIINRFNANGTINTATNDFTRSAHWYAIWSSTISQNENTRTITYSSHLATGGSPPPLQHFQLGEAVTILGRGTLERTGFTFAGWSVGNMVYQQGNRPIFNSNVTLTPVWTPQTLTVRFDHNGGTGAVPPPQIYESGRSFRLPQTPFDLHRAHHTFNGWNTQADGNGRRFSGGSTAVLRGETVLYAQWRPITYTIRYRSNGAIGFTPRNQSVQYSSTQTIHGYNGLRRRGQVFVGWNTRSDGFGTPYLSGETVPSANLTLFAIFVPVGQANRVTYNANGATGSVAAQTYTPNVWFNLQTNQGLTRAHHTFTGWYTHRTRRNALRFYSGQVVRFMGGNVPLYARWVAAEATLTYNGNGVTTGVPAAQTIRQGVSINVASGTTMQRPGHIFRGWNTQRNGNGTWYFGGLGTDDNFQRTISLSANTTLYAIWETADTNVISITRLDYRHFARIDYLFVTPLDNGDAVAHVTVGNTQSGRVLVTNEVRAALHEVYNRVSNSNPIFGLPPLETAIVMGRSIADDIANRYATIMVGSVEYYALWLCGTGAILEFRDFVYTVTHITLGVVSASVAVHHIYVQSKATGMRAGQRRTVPRHIATADLRVENSLSNIAHNHRNVTTAAAKNRALGYPSPPYLPNSQVIGFRPTQQTQFVRVYGSGSLQSGRWVMRRADVQGLTPAQIRDRFALPSTPTRITDVNIPAGTPMFAGTANRVPGWGNGGGVQFQIETYNPAWFVNSTPIPSIIP
ncbi:MAG: InlB B-repeat-containing protein [Defluviitaleaceae bacterium]|nr:InlB B-repeat-containing protein [Defluviitaleaceae bacterium]